MEHLSGTSLKSRLLALPTDIRLCWEDFPGSSTLAYYKNLSIITLKSFITLGLEYTNLVSAQEKCSSIEGVWLFEFNFLNVSSIS